MERRSSKRRSALVSQVDDVGVPGWIRLGDLFAGLDEAAGTPIASEHLDRAALTHEDGLALKRIRRNLSGNVSALSDLRVADLANWSSIGTKRLREVLQFLWRLEASIARTSSADLQQALGGEIGNDDAIWRQIAARVPEIDGAVGDENRRLRTLFPPLRELAGMRVSAPEVEPFARSRLERTALQSLRSQPSVPTFGALLELTPSQVAEWPGVDQTWLEVILGFLGHLSSNAFELADSAGPVEGDEADPPQVSADLTLVARWVATTRGTATWGDLLAAAHDPKPPAVEAAWRDLLATTVTHADLGTGSDVLNGYLTGLDDRHLTILTDRVISPDRRTLDDLGVEFAITRERVRQIERKLTDRLRAAFDESTEWEPVRWLAESVRTRLGSFAPVALHAETLQMLSGVNADLVTWLLGYRVTADHAVGPDFELPVAADCPRLYPETRVVDEFSLAKNLQEAGVREDLIDFAIGAIAGLDRVDDQLVDWTGSQVDRARAVLQVRDEPQTVDELFELVGGSSKVSFRNRILEDEEFMRVTKSKFGLRDWGGTRYTTIVELMADRLASGPRTIEELGRELEATYEVSANSIAMYSAAPIFKVTGDMVALRGRHDPYVPRDRPSSVAGLYTIDADHINWIIVVDLDLLRGSGRSLPYEIGTFMGLSPGDAAELTCGNSKVSLGWLETSHTGPFIGSLRGQAEAVSASAGSTIRLEFRRSVMTLDLVLVTPAGVDEHPSRTLSRITGIDHERCGDLAALAAAVSVEEADVVTVLEKRRDVTLARAASELSDLS